MYIAMFIQLIFRVGILCETSVARRYSAFLVNIAAPINTKF